MGGRHVRFIGLSIDFLLVLKGIVEEMLDHFFTFAEVLIVAHLLLV